jgi:hypothetical protein
MKYWRTVLPVIVVGLCLGAGSWQASYADSDPFDPHSQPYQVDDTGGSLLPPPHPCGVKGVGDKAILDNSPVEHEIVPNHWSRALQSN